MNFKYEVGDFVKQLKNGTGFITELDESAYGEDNSCLPYFVHFDNGIDEWCDEEELESFEL
jgi:hypothetical protein